MALFSKDGEDFIEISDEASDFDKLKEAGYQPYQVLTKDGENYITLPADEAVKNQAKLREAGLLSEAEWRTQQELQKPGGRAYKPSAGESFLTGALDQASLGIGKYATAGWEALTGGSSFKKELEAQEYMRERQKEEQGLASAAGTLTGALGTGAAGALGKGLFTAGQVATTLGGRAGMGAAAEAIPEAIRGTLESKEQDLGGKLLDGGVSAVIGGIAGGAGGALTKAPEAAAATAEAIGTGVQAAKGTGKLLSSAQQALIESGRRTEGAGFITKWIDKAGGLIDNVTQNYSNLGETRALAKELRKQLGEEVAELGDKELLTYVSALPGPNPVKRWQAQKIANATGESVDDILESLSSGPDAVSAARLFDVKESAQALAEDVSKSANQLRNNMFARYAELQAKARETFRRQPALAQEEIAKGLKELSGKSSKEAIETADILKDVYAKFSGEQPRFVGDKLVGQMRHVQDWASLSPQQQFDILKSARENVDAALIKRGVFDPTGKRIVSKVSDADSTLLNVRGEINTLLKTSEDMIDNDTTYAAFKGIDNLISSVSVRNPETKEFVIVPERLRDLFKDTKSGGELRLRLDLADQVADKLPAEEAKLVKDALASIKQSLEVAKQQKDLQTIYKNAAKFKKSEVRGLEAFFGEGQLPVIGVTDPKQMTQVYSRLTEFAKKYLNSDSFDKLSAKEKQALLMLEAQVRQKKMIGKDELIQATWQKIAKKRNLL